MQNDTTFIQELRVLAESMQEEARIEREEAKELKAAEDLAMSIREGTMVAKHLPSMAKRAALQGKTSFVMLVFKPNEYNDNFFSFADPANYLNGAAIAYDAAKELGLEVSNRYYNGRRDADTLCSIYTLDENSHLLIASF